MQFIDARDRTIDIMIDEAAIDARAYHNGIEIGSCSFTQRSSDNMLYLTAAQVADDYQRSGIGCEMLRCAAASLGFFYTPPSGEAPNDLVDLPLFYLTIEGAALLNSATRCGALSIEFRYPHSSSCAYQDWTEPYCWW